MTLPIKLKGVVKFPANVNGGTGISVDKTHGTYTIDLDYSEFNEVTTFDPAFVEVAIWNPHTDVWARVSLTGLITGSLTPAVFDIIAPTTTRGDIIYRNATTNTRLPAGTAGYFLQSNGAGTDPSYAGFLQSGTGAITRSWLNKVRDFVVTPEDYGALHDGVTDDTAAIQRAIDAVMSAGGGIVRIKPGANPYKTVAQLTINRGAAALFANIVWIEGNGPASCISNTSIGGAVLQYTGASGAAANQTYFKLSGFRLHGGHVAGSIGINVDKAAYWSINNVIVEQFDDGLVGTDVDQVGIYDSFFQYNTRGVRLNAAVAISEPNSFTLVNTNISSNSQYGMQIIGASAFTMVGGSIQYNGSIGGGASQFGAKFQDMGHGGSYGTAVFKGVVFEGNGGSGDFIGNQTVSAFIVVSFENCSFARTTAGYGTFNITEAGSVACTYRLEGNTFISGVGYTPSVARPTIDLSNANCKILDDGTNLFQNAVEQLIYPDAKLISLGFKNGPWVATTPAVTANGTPGTFAASCNMRTLVVGKLVTVQMVVTVSNIGTATGFKVPFPVTPKQTLFMPGGAGNAAAYSWLSTTGTIFKYDATTTPVVQDYFFSGSYEAA